MRFRKMWYCLKQGLVNIKRNKLFSFASIGTMAACILLIGIILAIIINVNYMEQHIEQQVGVTIFFEEGIEQESIDAIEEVIKADDRVKEYTYTSAEEAWESFQEEYFQDDPELAEGFDDDNPLANSASFNVFLNDIDDQDEFVSDMESVEGVRKVKYSETAKETLNSVEKLLWYASAALIIILLAVGIFLISNTVMVGISVRKQEIKIMKLIGATNTFVRAPFVIEGIVIGAIGSAIPVIIIRLAYSRIVDLIGDRFGALADSIPFAPVGEVMSILAPLGFAVGIGIGLIGSAVSIRKHLKV